MASFLIEGGYPLSGTIRASGNKNAALPVLAGCLMADNPVTVCNIPRIGDVNTMINLLVSLGVHMTWNGSHDVTLDSTAIDSMSLDRDLCSRVRGSILFAAPLLYRFGQVEIPLPGGDRIGRRRIDTHLLALEALGARVDVGIKSVSFSLPGKRFVGADIMLDEASVTATENTVLAAVIADGKTVIRNAACEPHVQDLCRMLIGMGADIEGVGTNELRVHGVQRLGGTKITLGADYLEVASLIILAAVTGSKIRIEQASPGDMRMIFFHLKRLGICVEVDGEDVVVPRQQRLCIQADSRGAIPHLDDAPWPGFPADLTSVATVAATQADGCILIHEKMFESRMFFVDQLIDMGARIVLCDPHRAVVIGPNHLHGGRMSSPDIRAGMALLIASLCAEGKSTIGNIQQIDRGYEQIDQRLRALGAKITRQD